MRQDPPVGVAPGDRNRIDGGVGVRPGSPLGIPRRRPRLVGVAAIDRETRGAHGGGRARPIGGVGRAEFLGDAAQKVALKIGDEVEPVGAAPFDVGCRGSGGGLEVVDALEWRPRQPDIGGAGDAAELVPVPSVETEDVINRLAGGRGVGAVFPDRNRREGGRDPFGLERAVVPVVTPQRRDPVAAAGGVAAIHRLRSRSDHRVKAHCSRDVGSRQLLDPDGSARPMAHVPFLEMAGSSAAVIPCVLADQPFRALEREEGGDGLVDGSHRIAGRVQQDPSVGVVGRGLEPAVRQAAG